MYENESRLAKEFVDSIAKNLVVKGYKDQRLYHMEEKIIFSQTLISKVRVFECKQADKDALRVTNYSKVSKRELLLDINELIVHFDKGNSLSGYLFSVQKMFARKHLRQRFYVMDEIYVDGKSCNNLEDLLLVQNVLKVELTLRDLINIWGLGDYIFISYTQQYFFFKYLLMEAIDLVQKYNIASLPLENIKFDLEREVS